MKKAEALELLRRNVVPALGCTEPVCVALAAADAAKQIGGTVRAIRLEVSRNIYKNGVSVGIACFDKVGLHYAAALGAMIRDPASGLELMRAVTPQIAAEATAFAESGAVELRVAEVGGIYVRCCVETETGTAVTTIRGGHTAVAEREVNGEAVYAAVAQAGSENRSRELVSALKELTVAEIRRIAESMTEEETAFLAEGAEMNQALADYGLQQGGGIGIARTLRDSHLLGQGFMSRVMLRVAAATEARLEGCPLTTMSSAGSGSKGIALMIPVAEMAVDAGASREKMLQTLAFACLMNEYINAYVGKLSAICACAMASAAAASAAMVFLQGGSDEQITFAIRNMCGSITGMVCDGGKVGCALKLSAAMSAAVFSAALALGQVGLRPSDGICADSAEACIRNMGRVSNPGMQETDREILRIMLDKK